MPVAEPEQLISVYGTDEKNTGNALNYLPISYPNYLDYRDQNSVFSGLAAFSGVGLSLSAGSEPERLNGQIVSGNYFDVLGVKAAVGRTFLPEEDSTPGTHPVAVISHPLWQRRFDGDRSLVGKTLTLNNQSFTVVGIAPESFRGTAAIGNADIWMPLAMHDQVLTGNLRRFFNERRALIFNAVGRLKPGVSAERAQAGNFFERPEIRDLLCIVSMTCEPDGHALFRLAHFKEYGFSFSDVQALTTYAYTLKRPFPEALKFVPDAEKLTGGGKIKLQRLAEHFSSFHFGSNPWTVLVQYLFVKSNYLRLLAAEDTIQAQQKRLAIYQFLLLAYQLRDRFTEERGDQKQHFLNYLLRLKVNREERQLRQTPDWAEGINAVRMLTIHSSKGLEFGAVHLPGLSEGEVPLPKRPNSCPPPASMLREEMLDWHDEEEECLFFVALSRARDRLCIYRANEYEHRERGESPLMRLVKGVTPDAIPPTFVRPAPRVPQPETPLLSSTKPFYEQHLREYLVCPLKYYYRVILNIFDRRSDSPYAQSNLGVHKVWQFIEGELAEGRPVDHSSVSAAFDENWEKYGPKGHAYEADYRRDAVGKALRTLGYQAAASSRMLRPELRLKVVGGEIIVVPDYVEISEDGGSRHLLIQDLHFGSSPEKPPSDDYYALYDVAVEQTYPGAKRRIQAMYMSDGVALEVTVKADRRRDSLQKYERAIQGILRAEVEPRPSDRQCPYCSGYHICPAAEIQQVH